MQDSFIKNFDSRILYTLMFVIFFFMNYFTPFQGDDYTYAFNYLDKTRIENLVDVFESQYVHYQVANGRTIPHLLEQTFAGITGKWAFDLFNSFLMVCLVGLVTNKLVKHNEALKDSALLVVNITFFALLFLFSFPGQSIFWMAGGLNYLLPTVLALVIIRLFKSEKEHNLFGLFFLALIGGWCQEAISIPVAASMFLLFTLYKEYKNKKNAVLFSGYIIGTLLIVLSPGTLSRLSSGELHTTGSPLFVLINKLLETNACLHELYIFWMTVVLIVFLMLTKQWQQFKRHRDLFILWGINVLFFLALGFPHERITLFFSVISFVLVADFVLTFLVKKGKLVEYILIMLFLVANTIGTMYALDSIYNYKQMNDRLLKSIETAASNHVVLPIEENPEPSRFIYPLALNKGIHTGSNSSIASYFGKYSVQFLQPDLYAKVTEIMKPDFHDEVDSSFVSAQQLPLYVADGLYYLKMDSKYFYEGIKAVASHPIVQEPMTWRQEFIRNVLHSLDNGVTKLDAFVMLKSDRECYCFITHLAPKEKSFQIQSAKNDSIICSFTK